VLFTDSTFLLRFLPVVLALFFIAVAVTPRRWRAGTRRFSLPNTVLFAGSVVFLAGVVGPFARVIAGAVVFNYLGALAIDWARRIGTSSSRPTPLPAALLTLAVTGNLVLLGVYKYAIPLGDGLVDRSFAAPQLLAPLGLTFIVCHSISYVVEVFRGSTPVQVSPIRASLYLIFFPLLCAGPLTRYSEMGPQLAQRRVTMAAFAYGVRRWLIGFCKVVFLANTLAGPVEAVFSMPSGELGMTQAWLGAICFTLQIYLDLSGYADMGIGFGRMFGFRLFENFRWPYGAETLTEFWRRWNISLLDWCRSYLGLSLDDAGHSPIARVRRTVVLFLCVGLWHGPGWSVVVWGVLNGAVVALEQAGLSRRIVRLPKALRHAYLLFVVIGLWVVFRAESLAGASVVLGAMTGVTGATQASSLMLTPIHWTVLALAGLSVAPVWPSFGRWLVTVDALTTSVLILVSTTFIFIWRQLVNTARFLTSRR
jgi:alginate O-acetyltransferase complex protein AlgI